MMKNKILICSFLSFFPLIGMEEGVSSKLLIVPNSWYGMTFKQLQKENRFVDKTLVWRRCLFLQQLAKKYSQAWETINELQYKYPYQVLVTCNYDVFREHENAFYVKKLTKMNFEDIEELEKRVERLKHSIHN